MKTVTLILFAAALLVADDRPNQDAQPKQAASAPAASQSVPAGAVEIEPLFWRYTGADGKTWMYRQTPFGLSRWENKPAPRAAVEDANPVLATDLGDRVQFESKTPFGTAQWVRNKTDLSETEKAMLVRAGRKSAAGEDSGAHAPPSGTQEKQ